MKKNNIKINIIFFTLIPLIACIITCLLGGIYPWELYLPASNFNDEVFYYKQIESIIDYGIPQGYFGYNETSAKIGTIGAWNPLILMPYVLYGKLFGWDLFSPLIVNFLIMTFAFCIVGCVMKPQRKDIILGVILYMLVPSMARYTISGMNECISYAGMIISFVFIYKFWRDNCILKSTVALVFILTILKPYFIILIIPIIFKLVILERKYRKEIFCIIFTGIVAICINTIIIKFFCAEYFSSVYNLDIINKLFDEGIFSLLIFIIGVLTEGVIGIWGYAINVNKAPEVGYIYILLITFTLIEIFLLCFKNKYIDSLEKKIAIFSLIVVNISMFLAIIFLYALNPGSRHVVPFIILNIFALTIISKKTMIFITLLLLITNMCLPFHKYYDTLPQKDNVLIEETNNRTKIFNDLFELSDECWDNTVLWIFSENHQICYSIPSGFGINMGGREYLNTTMPKTGWIITDLEIDKIRGYQMIYSDNKCKLYKNIDYDKSNK